MELPESQELCTFREKWKKELLKNQDGKFERSNERAPSFSCQSSPQRRDDAAHISEDIDCVEEEFAVPSRILDGGNNDVCEKQMQSLINLPNPEKRHKHDVGQASHKDSNKNNCLVQSQTVEKSFLEQLICDIDEITVIPFFDTQLPREVGVQIFSYLEVKDLCRCAQVSKSWKHLAEDQLLWHKIACARGYVKITSTSSQTKEEELWKDFVQEKISFEHQLRKNWRERTCKLSLLEFERGGTLCAVSHHDHQLICAGYSNGSVLLWETESEISYKMLQTTHDLQPDKQQVTCTAVAETLCAAGFQNGDVNVWHNSVTCEPLHHCRCDGSVKTVALSTRSQPTVLAMSEHELRIVTAESCGQWKCQELQTFEEKIGHVQFMPSNPQTSKQLVAIATQDALSLLVPGQKLVMKVDQVVGGKLTCLDSSPDNIAVGVGSFGYGILGNKVRLYSHTGKMVALFSGHQREISCVNLADSPPHGMVSGGHDGRVCLYDMRCGKAVLLLRGHKSPVTAVQMDQWKVVSGSCDGFLLVWDQRMAGTLWMMHARHPIDLCHFGGSRLLTANVPVEKNPQQGMWYTDDLVLHRRHRGLIRLLDFGTDNRTVGLPDICTSGYDDTSGYNYNIKLSVPYDTI